MHLLTEIEEEAKFEQSDEEGDIKRNSDEDKEEIVTGRIASLRCACSTQDKTAIPRCWILLDSQSIVDIFSNKKLLTNIHDAKNVLTLHCNAGKAIVTQKGDLKGYGTIWYHPTGIVNVLSLYNV